MKRVLLLGDSIRMGYCHIVKDDLRERAEVYYPTENCRYTQHTYVELANWMDSQPADHAIDVIHWNNGHWDISHWDGSPEPLNSIPLYCEMLERIYRRLIAYCPKAKIVFALTTPMNPAGTIGKNPRSNQEIQCYNQAAAELMQRLGVPVNDLYQHMKDCSESFYIDHVHYTEDGYRRLAERVGAVIRPWL